MKMNFTVTLLVAGIGLGLSIQAQAAKYACPVEQGAKCMSTAKVYEATNSSSDINGTPANDVLPPAPAAAVPVAAAPVSTAARGTMVFVPAEHAALTVKGDSLSVVNPNRMATTVVNAPLPNPAIASAVPKTTITTNGYEPFREPAKILQLYVAAWQDEYGDLHLSERIVTEIVPRKWSIGVQESGAGGDYRLLEFPGAKVSTEKDAGQKSGGGGN